MRSNLIDRWVLPVIVTILSLTDGVIHFLLDFILFHGRFIGSPFPSHPPAANAGPGPGGPPPGPPPNPLLTHLNELFLLNAIGYVVLVVVFWLAPRWFGHWGWTVDVVLILYTAASIVGWLYVGAPNPDGLGYLSKLLEVALIATLVVHAQRTLTGPAAAGRSARAV